MSFAFPGSERCWICNDLIVDPEDHSALGRVTSNHLDPLHGYNHAHFHRTCLAVWPRLSALIDDLEALKAEETDAEKIQRTVLDLATLRSKAA